MSQPPPPESPNRELPRLPSATTLTRFCLQGVTLALVANALIVAWTFEPETWKALADFRPTFLPALLGLVIVGWLCAGTRVWWLARTAGHPIRWRQGMVIAFSAQFGTAASPSGVGAPVIRVTLMKRAGVPLDVGATLLAADYATDLTFYALLVPLAGLFVATDPEWRALLSDLQYKGNGGFLVLIVAILAASLVLAWLFRHRLRRAGKGGRAEDWMRFGRENIKPVPGGVGRLVREHRGAMAVNLLLSACQWFGRYGTLPMILLAFGIDRNPIPLVLLQAALFATSMFFVAPGGGGGVEALAAFALRHLVPINLVGVVLLIWRLLTYVLNLVVGGMVFFWVCGRLDHIFPRHKDAEPGTEPETEAGSTAEEFGMAEPVGKNA